MSTKDRGILYALSPRLLGIMSRNIDYRDKASGPLGKQQGVGAAQSDRDHSSGFPKNPRYLPDEK